MDTKSHLWSTHSKY